MIELQRFGAHDRVLVVAPHPDDESLATGGALQLARAAGAACRVLVVTDGDNNPWPQRWDEKLWHLGPAERERWGARRRSEALAALGVLGIAPGDVRCLGLPDLGLTDALMRGEPDVARLLATQIGEFEPTRVFLPALEDRHPDHSALHVLTRLALGHWGGAPPSLYTFGVHGVADLERSVVLTLSDAQREIKRRAILQHATQMRLSRKRFVGYARAQEPYREASGAGVPDASHPLQAVVTCDGRLDVAIDRQRWGRSLRGLDLFVVADDAVARRGNRQVALTGSARGQIIDTAANRQAGEARIDAKGAILTVAIPLPSGISGGWVKLARPVPGLFVLDRVAWQTIRRVEPEPAAVPV